MSLSISEIIHEREHELSAARIIDELKLCASLGEIIGAVMVIENYSIPDQQGGPEDLLELFRGWTCRAEEQRFNESEDRRGDLLLVHSAMLAALRVDVEGREAVQ